jgi:hypothetical protein
LPEVVYKIKIIQKIMSHHVFKKLQLFGRTGILACPGQTKMSDLLKILEEMYLPTG